MGDAGDLVLRTLDGRTGAVTATVTRPGEGARVATLVGFVLAGIAGGAACIIVPVLHLFTTWGLPLLGVVLGLRAYRCRARVRGAGAECPACRKPISVLDCSLGDRPLLTQCPECNAALELSLSGGT